MYKTKHNLHNDKGDDMKEHEARKAVLKRQDLTDGDKVIMMAILMTMDWDSWTNRTSFKAIANLTGKKRSSISRNIKRIEKLGYITRDFMTAEDCKAPVMTINQERLTCSQSVNKGVNEMLTGCSQDVNRGVNEELTGGVNSSVTDGVNRSVTLSTTINNQPILKSNINPWGVPSEHLWGDVLRGEDQ
jgi:hypothetical protein